MSYFYSSSWPIVQSYTEAGRKPAPCTALHQLPSLALSSRPKSSKGRGGSHRLAHSLCPLSPLARAITRPPKNPTKPPCVQRMGSVYGVKARGVLQMGSRCPVLLPAAGQGWQEPGLAAGTVPCITTPTQASDAGG